MNRSRQLHTGYLAAPAPFASGEMEVGILFRFTPGEPEQGPTYACGGVPASGPDIEFLSACLPNCSLTAQLHSALEIWAGEYLATDQGQEAALAALGND